MGEDVNNVDPTLGFIIKTIEYQGLVITSALPRLLQINHDDRYKLNICESATTGVELTTI